MGAVAALIGAWVMLGALGVCRSWECLLGARSPQVVEGRIDDLRGDLAVLELLFQCPIGNCDQEGGGGDHAPHGGGQHSGKEADPDIHQGTRGCEEHSPDRKSTRLNSSHLGISYAVFCLKK